MISDLKEWWDKHKYKPYFRVTLSNVITHEGVTLNTVYQEVELRVNGFGQRKAVITKSTYNEEYFSGKHKNHPYWKKFIIPWLKGFNVDFNSNGGSGIFVRQHNNVYPIK